MTTGTLWVALGALLSVILYSIGFVQIKRAFPARATWLIAQCILAALTGTAAAAVRGVEPFWWATAPACLAAACFLAGKGSVAVLINEGGQQKPVPTATAQARKRLGVISVIAFMVALAVVLIIP